MPNIITYRYDIDPNAKGSIYVNVTNQCTNRCVFCIRSNAGGVGNGADLWLETEPTVDEIKEALKNEDVHNCKEIVFCGYGEPLMRFDDVMQVCQWLKDTYNNPTVRINTNGHANAVACQDVTPQMRGLVDIISISLNASTSAGYEAVCNSDYGESGFDLMLDFAKRATQHVPQVVLSVVDVLLADEIEKCRKIAEDAGCLFRVRKLEE